MWRQFRWGVFKNSRPDVMGRRRMGELHSGDSEGGELEGEDAMVEVDGYHGGSEGDGEGSGCSRSSVLGEAICRGRGKIGYLFRRRRLLRWFPESQSARPTGIKLLAPNLSRF